MNCFNLLVWFSDILNFATFFKDLLSFCYKFIICSDVEMCELCDLIW
jgi:hypothetical protein